MRMLDPVWLGKAEVLVHVRANLVSIEMNRIESRRQRSRQCRLAGPWQTHDQNFPVHWLPYRERRTLRARERPVMGRTTPPDLLMQAGDRRQARKVVEE
jgi:hypothetical protein